MPNYDVFVSYRRKDANVVLPLVDALRAQGLAVWLDQGAIEDFAPITERIRAGLESSKCLLAWYSQAYPESRPCQMELTAAYVAAQAEGDPRRRVLVVNPEGDVAHIEPSALRDEQQPPAPTDAAGYESLAATVAAHVRSLGPNRLRAVLPSSPPRQFGLKLVGSSRFVGRLSDLWAVHSALHRIESAIVTASSNPGVAVISGMGGVGKTLLVEEYALRFAAAFPGGVFWLRALGNDGDHESLSFGARNAIRTAQMQSIASALGIPILDLAPAELEAALAATLAQLNLPFLWVVDDLAGHCEADELRSWLAPHPLGKTLFTTRSRAYGAFGTAVSIEVLNPQDAFNLLASHQAPSSRDATDAMQGIVADLGYHPLAIEITGAALRAQAGLIDAAGFRAALADKSRDELEFAAQLASVLLTGHEANVAATLLRSVRALPTEGRDVLRLAAILPAAPIPVSLAVEAIQRFGGLLSQEDARRRAAVGWHQAHQACLADEMRDSRAVHTLVSRAIRFNEEAALLLSMRAAAIATLETILAPSSDVRRLRALELEVLHARALWSDAASDYQLALLGELLVNHDRERGLYATARGVAEQVLGVRKLVLGQWHPETVRSIHTLALVLHEIGDFMGAYELQVPVFEITQRILGDHNPLTLTAKDNLASTLSSMGHIAQARDMHAEVLERRREVLGEDDVAVLSSMSNLASSMSDVGELTAARALQQEVLERSKRVLGPDHPTTLRAMASLAGKLRALGDATGARELEEAALAQQRAALGDDHPESLTSLSNLASTLSIQGDRDAARQAANEALVGRRRVLGENHPTTLASMDNLALLDFAEGNYDRARATQEDVLREYRAQLGDSHPDTLISMHNLAGTLKELGKLGEARALFEEALATRERILGCDHPSVLANVDNLAGVLDEQGDHASARELRQRACDGYVRTLGSRHRDTVIAMVNLAVTEKAEGHIEQARDRMVAASELAPEVFGEHHPETLTVLHNLVGLHLECGDTTRAREIAEHVIAQRVEVLGEEHPHTRSSMQKLSQVYLAERDHHRARGMIDRLLVIQERVLGEEHADTLGTKDGFGADDV